MIHVWYRNRSYLNFTIKISPRNRIISINKLWSKHESADVIHVESGGYKVRATRAGVAGGCEAPSDQPHLDQP